MTPFINLSAKFRILLIMLVVGVCLLRCPDPISAAPQIDITGPAGSDRFGDSITLLPNGNIVVVDTKYDHGDAMDAGAVYLYNGATGALISTLVGSTYNDQVGSGGVTILENGNFVVSSPFWNNTGFVDAGAVTWGSKTSGVNGPISSANSLIGIYGGDRVGAQGVVPLSSGNYVVISNDWNNDAGAVTWLNGTTGTSGGVTASNSLVGSTSEDRVGLGGVTVLTNGNYVVNSPEWWNDTQGIAGAVTWGSGTSGVAGEVSAANSLVGPFAGNLVGAGGITALANGNYVVSSPYADGPVTDAGAVTWCNGAGATVGFVTTENSLVGSTYQDQIGSLGVKSLSNGNYVVVSPGWDNGTAVDAGAVTLGNGTTGIVGAVSAANSLVGSTPADQVGNGYITELTNSHYVVISPDWDNSAVVDAGAVTWGSGTSGVTGVVSIANSLVGSTAFDRVGLGGVTALNNGNYVVSSLYWDNAGLADVIAVSWGNGSSGTSGEVSVENSLVGNPGIVKFMVSVTPLANGNYVVNNPNWDNGSAANAGAVTWGNGNSGTTGLVSSTNSLVGSTTDDTLGGVETIALSNGNYVVISPAWDNGSAANAGAVTWGDGTTGTSGEISPAKSLVGTSLGDRVGSWGIAELTNGNYVVCSEVWDNVDVVDAGAVTWASGTSGISGEISPANSLVGSASGDKVGHLGATPLTNGNYVVSSPYWDNADVTDVGAVTWGDGASGISGTISPANSLVGTVAGDQVGDWGAASLTNGSYVFKSGNFDHDSVTNSGAVTWVHGTGSTSGLLSADNSVIGTTDDYGWTMNYQYDPVNQQLVVGRWMDTIVTLFRIDDTYIVRLPLILK